MSPHRSPTPPEPRRRNGALYPSDGVWQLADSGISVVAGPWGPRIRQELVGDPEERAANARLIAAAPELLAAARRATAGLMYDQHVGLQWLKRTIEELDR